MSNFLTGHRFYSKSNTQKRVFFAKLLTVSFGVVLLLGLFSYYTQFYFIGILGLTIFLTLLAPFIDVPGLKKSGGLIYYSLFLLAEKPKEQKMTIHGGTLFDYYFGLKFQTTGKQRTQFILQQYLTGLLNLIEVLNKSEVQIDKIQGSSYFINNKTAKRIGFTPVKLDRVQQLILLFNYINLMVTQSIARNKWSFPTLSGNKSFQTTPAILISKKSEIENILNKLIEN